MEAVRVDSKGRVIIPKYIRKKAKIKEVGYVKIRIEGDTIVIEPIQSIADKEINKPRLLRRGKVK